jgi:hypothetical protein
MPVRRPFRVKAEMEIHQFTMEAEVANQRAGVVTGLSQEYDSIS